jgi:hypothetical protein
MTSTSVVLLAACCCVAPQVLFHLQASRPAALAPRPPLPTHIHTRVAMCIHVRRFACCMLFDRAGAVLPPSLPPSRPSPPPPPPPPHPQPLGNDISLRRFACCMLCGRAGALSPPSQPPGRPTPPVAVLPQRATHRAPPLGTGGSRPAGGQPLQQCQQQQGPGHPQASAAGQQRGSSTLPAAGRVCGAAGAGAANVQQQQQVSASSPTSHADFLIIMLGYIAWWQSSWQQ